MCNNYLLYIVKVKFFFFLISKLMDHYNHTNKPFNLNAVYDQLNLCQFKPECVEDFTMDKLGMEIVPAIPFSEDSSSSTNQHSYILKSLSLEAALMTSAKERTKSINRVYYTMSHLESKNIVINILMSLMNSSLETGGIIAWKLNMLGFTNVPKIVEFIKLLLIMNVWTDREFKDNAIFSNVIEKNVLELFTHIIITLAEHFQPAYNFAISIPVQVSMLIVYNS